MTTLAMMFIVATAVLVVALFIITGLYINVSNKYEKALDKIEYMEDKLQPDISTMTFKLLARRDRQYDKLYKLLFEILLDLLNEDDDGVAIGRLINLRDKVAAMALSNSEYVKNSYNLINIKKQRELNDIMCWLCAVLDIKRGKEDLSILTRRDYIKQREDIVLIQRQLNDLKDEIDIEQEKIKSQEESYYEPDYEEDFETYDQEEYQEEDQEEFEEEEDTEADTINYDGSKSGIKSFKSLFKR